MELTEQDQEWLRRSFPELVPQAGGNRVYRGRITFDMLYDQQQPGYVINPANGDGEDNRRIRDTYSLEIDFDPKTGTLPTVREVAGRIQHVATTRHLQLADVHINPTGEACLCFEYEKPSLLPKGFNVPDFFHRLVIPFFYAESYFEQHNTWPWGQYSHGELGMLEWYLEHRDHGGVEVIRSALDFLIKYKDKKSYGKQLRSSNKVKGHQFCPCGSGHPFRKCHALAFKGLWNLREDISTMIKIDKTNNKLRDILNGI